MKEKQREFLIGALRDVFLKHDPIDIYYGDAALQPDSPIMPNPDEYDPEIKALLRRLAREKPVNVRDLQKMLHQVMCGWFSSEVAGPIENYCLMADEIWGFLVASDTS